MDVAAAIGMALVLLVATVAIHYEVLSATFAGLPRLGVPPRLRILVAMAAIFGAHLAEITLYAVAFYGMERLQLGSIGATAMAHGSITSIFRPRATRRWASAMSLRMVSCASSRGSRVLTASS